MSCCKRTPECVAFVWPNETQKPTRVRPQHGCRCCSCPEKVFPSILTVHRPEAGRQSCTNVAPTCFVFFVPFIFGSGTDVIHQGHRARETSFCRVRAVVPPHRLSSSAVSHHRASKYLLMSQVRLVSPSLDNCATVRFSSFCAPAILRNRTQHGPGRSVTTWKTQGLSRKKDG